MRRSLVAFVADVHVSNPRWRGGPTEGGINTRGRLILGVLEAAVRRANARGADLVVLGDLFDASDPTPQLEAAVMAVLDQLDDHKEVHLVLGNHDVVSTSPGDHALGPLDRHPSRYVHARPALVECGGHRLTVVPYAPGDARAYIPAALDALGTAKHGGALLCLHAGLIAEHTPPYLRGASNALEVDALGAILERYGLAGAIAGDWHVHAAWAVRQALRAPVPVWQCGALVPTDFRNPGLAGYGSLCFWDGETLTREELPGPRFVVARTLGEWAACLNAVRTDPPTGVAPFPLYVRRVVDDPAQLAEATARMKAECDVGLFMGGEVVPGEGAARAVAREAARGVRSATTLRGQVAAHVAGLGLGAQAPAVEALCLGYLGLDGVPA